MGTVLDTAPINGLLTIGVSSFWHFLTAVANWALWAVTMVMHLRESSSGVFQKLITCMDRDTMPLTMLISSITMTWLCTYLFVLASRKTGHYSPVSLRRMSNFGARLANILSFKNIPPRPQAGGLTIFLTRVLSPRPCRAVTTHGWAQLGMQCMNCHDHACTNLLCMTCA